jgi:hypothetical protein
MELGPYSTGVLEYSYNPSPRIICRKCTIFYECCETPLKLLCKLVYWIPESSALDYSIKTLGLWNPRSSVLESCTTRRSLMYRIPVTLLLVFHNTDVLLSKRAECLTSTRSYSKLSALADLSNHMPLPDSVTKMDSKRFDNPRRLLRAH